VRPRFFDNWEIESTQHREPAIEVVVFVNPDYPEGLLLLALMRADSSFVEYRDTFFGVVSYLVVLASNNPNCSHARPLFVLSIRSILSTDDSRSITRASIAGENDF
jgi:hypothetical protein